MPGLGTIVNCAAIIVGGLLGLLFKNGIKERFRITLVQALALSTMFIGISGALKGMFSVSETGIQVDGTMTMILSLVLGSIVGELINIDELLERFGAWLKIKVGSQNDSQFIDAFVSASLTVCIGAMAIVGSLEDGLTGNHATLFAKALLDGIIVIIFTSAMGKGAIFSAIPVGVLQGVITILAKLIEPYLSEIVITNLSFVGSVLIFAVGVNLMFDNIRIKVANMVPALIFVYIFSVTGLPF